MSILTDALSAGAGNPHIERESDYRHPRGGAGAFFLLLDEPEVYGLPPDPVVTTRDLPVMWRTAGLAAVTLLAGAAAAFVRARS